MAAQDMPDAWEAALADLPGIARALAVDAGCAFLFVVLQPGHELTGPLRAEIYRRLRSGQPENVPAAVFAVPDLPRAADGRALRRAVQRLLSGEAAERVAIAEEVANLASLEYFVFLFNNL